jgi:hypothetical protein
LRVFRINQDGYFLYQDEVRKEEIDATCVLTPPPEGIFEPFRWTGGEWVSEFDKENFEEKAEQTEVERLQEDRKLSDLALLELTEMLLK